MTTTARLTDITARYPSLSDEFKQDYRLVFEFLNDMSRVESELQRVEHDLGNVQSREGYVRFLEQQERSLGFPRDALVVNQLLDELDFLEKVRLGHPIHDRAFRNDFHGTTTHRLQFILMGRHLGGQLNNTVPQLYQKLGEPSTRGQMVPKRSDASVLLLEHSLWFDLVDRDREQPATAASPEDLGHYISRVRTGPLTNLFF